MSLKELICNMLNASRNLDEEAYVRILYRDKDGNVRDNYNLPVANFSINANSIVINMSYELHRSK